MRNYLKEIYKLFVWENSSYSAFITSLILIAFFVYPYPEVAMWFGFCVAAYSAIANDSIQTIGTFICSNTQSKWWKLWFFIGSIFVLTILYSWIKYDGDISFQRLASKGLNLQPVSFTFLQLFSPIVLLILTRFKIPVSTTFLLLSVFTSTSAGIFLVLKKSLYGYGLAFISAFLIWIAFEKIFKEKFTGVASKRWAITQWITSGTLWSIWVMQDAANIAVFLPRKLTLPSFIFVNLFVFLGLGLLFYLKGDKIQEIISKKENLTDVRNATIVDFVYAIILIFFTYINSVPMSTTWVFLGLLGGRELGIRFSNSADVSIGTKKGIILKDVGYAAFGLCISLTLAILANQQIRKEFIDILDFK